MLIFSLMMFQSDFRLVIYITKFHFWTFIGARQYFRRIIKQFRWCFKLFLLPTLKSTHHHLWHSCLLISPISVHNLSHRQHWCPQLNGHLWSVYLVGNDLDLAWFWGHRAQCNSSMTYLWLYSSLYMPSKTWW